MSTSRLHFVFEGPCRRLPAAPGGLGVSRSLRLRAGCERASATTQNAPGSEVPQTLQCPLIKECTVNPFNDLRYVPFLRVIGRFGSD